MDLAANLHIRPHSQATEPGIGQHPHIIRHAGGMVDIQGIDLVLFIDKEVRV